MSMQYTKEGEGDIFFLDGPDYIYYIGILLLHMLTLIYIFTFYPYFLSIGNSLLEKPLLLYY